MNQVQVRMFFVELVLRRAGVSSPAQQTVATNPDGIVPPPVSFNGVLTNVSGKPIVDQ
jgi:hypothetical protein